MVSTTWVASKLNPYAHWLKLAAVALAAASLVAAGWMSNGWRLGQKLARAEAAAERRETARQTALTERQQKAMGDALGAVLKAQAALADARRANAQLVAKAAQRAPTAPQYACRELPLPEDYLEVFRQ